MEKINKKIKNNIKPILGGILMLSLLLGASYAFIYSGESSMFDGGLTFKSGLNISYTLTSTTDVDYDINVFELQQDGKEYIESEPGIGIVMLGNNSDYPKIKCGYELWYNPTSPFTNSALASGKEEMVLLGIDSSGENTSFKVNLDGITTETKLATAYITVNGKTADITQNWEFILRHYNLDTDQSDNMGKTFGGTISFKALECVDAS